MAQEMDDVRDILRHYKKRQPPKYVYLVRNVDTNTYKIGVTSKVDERIATLSRQCGAKLTTVKVAPSCAARACECLLHDMFSHRRCSGEWFALSATDVRGVLKVLSVAEAFAGVTR